MSLEPGSILELASDFLEASGGNDAGTMIGFYAPDGTVWHNYDDKVIDPVASARSLDWLDHTVPDLVGDDAVITTMRAGFVIRSVLTGTTAKGADVRIHTCVVVTLDPGATITRTDEYLDSAALAPLLSR